MPGLSTWAVRRPVIALVSWLVALVVVVGLGTQVGGELNDSFDLPDTESKVATDLLASSGTDTSRLDGGATIVWSPATGTAVDPAVAEQVVPFLTEVAALSSVACVTNPLDPQGAPLGTDCPESTGPDPAAMQALTPEEQQVLAASFSPDQPRPDRRVRHRLLRHRRERRAERLHRGRQGHPRRRQGAQQRQLAVGAQGQVLEFAGQEPPSSEAIGLARRHHHPAHRVRLDRRRRHADRRRARRPDDGPDARPRRGQLPRRRDVRADARRHDRPRRRHRLRAVRHEPLPAGTAARPGAEGRGDGVRQDRGPRRPVRRQHRHHRPARPVRARHQLLQRPRRRRSRDRAHGHAVGAVDAACAAEPARHQGPRLATAVGQEAGRPQGPPGGYARGRTTAASCSASRSSRRCWRSPSWSSWPSRCSACARASPTTPASPRARRRASPTTCVPRASGQA